MTTDKPAEGGCPRCRSLKKIAAIQAEDEGLWCDAETITEAYIQQELRYLTKAVEEEIQTDEDIARHFEL